MFFDKNWECISGDEFSKYKKIIIFGWSLNNHRIFQYIPKEAIMCIFDNDKTKWGTIIDGIKVEQPRNKVDEILVTAVMDYKNLIPQFKELGFDTYFFHVCEDAYEKCYQKYISFYIKNSRKFEFSKEVERCKYLHIIPDDKFFLPTVAMIEDAFDMKEHAFIIYLFNGPNINNRYGIWEKYLELSEKYGNIVIVDDAWNIMGYDCNENLERALEKSKSCEKIIFHGEWLSSPIKDFFAKECRLRLVKEKGIWIVWSGNMGKDKENELNIKQVLKYCKVCTGLNEKEYQHLSKIVNLENKYHFYSSTSQYSWSIDKPIEKNGRKNVIVSHSCFRYNNIIESLKILEKYKGQIEVYAVASYGEEAYINEVMTEGKKIYGEHFHAVKEFMKYPQYVEFLNEMDVAVWGEEVAGGHTTLQILFWLKKKVYLKTDAYMMEVERGYQPYNYYQILNESFDQLWQNEYQEKNYEVAEEVFSKEKAIQRWRELYEFDMNSL